MPESNVTVAVKVIRGPESWTFIYVALGFAITIEGQIISLISPLIWPWNLAAYIAIAVLTFLLFIGSGRFQNWLIASKNSYESRAR